MRYSVSHILFITILLLMLRYHAADDFLDDHQCHQQFGNHTLTWIAESAMFQKYPPHIVSQPGSGSSWLRQLLEFSTGFHTGSVDTFDFEYLGPNRFAGERACGLRMCALRAHPHHFDFTHGKLRFRHHYLRDKCKRGLIREIKRLIVLVRNPFDMIWSYYQSLYTLEHSQYITNDRFDIVGWNFFGPHIAKLMNREFHRILLPAIDSYPESDVHVLQYEDLKAAIAPSRSEEGMQRGVKELRRLLDFMGYSPTDQQLRCAFQLADISGFAYRRGNNEERVTSVEAYFSSTSQANGDAFITKEKNSLLSPVYRKSYKHFICEMREELQAISDRFNYTALPTPMELDFKKISAGRLPIAFQSFKEYYDSYEQLCHKEHSVALSAWNRHQDSTSNAEQSQTVEVAPVDVVRDQIGGDGRKNRPLLSMAEQRQHNMRVIDSRSRVTDSEWKFEH